MMPDLEKLENLCFLKAQHMILNNMTKDMDIFELTDLLINIELEKEEKQRIEDSKIDYNDEIIEIEELGELETVDISVTGDQLFYCNNILTKNSMGITHTADAIFGLISNEELEERKQLMIKQLKNRWGDLSYYKRFMVGIDRAKMKIFDLEEDAQTKVMTETKNTKEQDKPVFDKGSFNDEWSDVSSKRKKKLKEAEDIL